MMTTQQNTRLYKVVFEQTRTNKLFSMLVEAENSYEAGRKALEKIGIGYEVIQARPAKTSELS